MNQRHYGLFTSLALSFLVIGCSSTITSKTALDIASIRAEQPFGLKISASSSQLETLLANM